MNLLLRFAPLKPFATEALIILRQPDGGRFKLPVSLLANQPRVEGRLVVELPNGSTPGTLKFKHQNVLNVYSNFRAYFTPQSSERFSVSP